MKKWILVLIIFLSCISAYSAEIKYKNIKDGSKIIYNSNSQIWSTNLQKNSDFLTKTSNSYISKNDLKEYYTYCDYEFILNGKFIGYSNTDLNFYEFTIENDCFKEKKLTEDEIQKLFPEYKIIKLSEFSDKTHSLKIKKNGNKKIILYNDIDGIFSDYCFTSGNSSFETYPLKGFINVNKGMVQFSSVNSSDSNNNSPWFVLLIR